MYLACGMWMGDNHTRCLESGEGLVREMARIKEDAQRALKGNWEVNRETQVGWGW